MFKEILISKASISQRGLVYGAGVNDAPYKTKYRNDNGEMVRCPYYSRWSHLLRRCLSHSFKSKNPTYQDCSICKEWLLFSSFKAWMIKQDWQGNELDKDIIIPGNKLYSPETCLFVNSEVNNIILSRSNKRGEYKQGVVKVAGSGSYRARCKVNGKDKHIGTFKTENEAFQAYKDFKYSLIAELASRQNSKVRKALLDYVII